MLQYANDEIDDGRRWNIISSFGQLSELSFANMWRADISRHYIYSLSLPLGMHEFMQYHNNNVISYAYRRHEFIIIDIINTWFYLCYIVYIYKFQCWSWGDHRYSKTTYNLIQYTIRVWAWHISIVHTDNGRSRAGEKEKKRNGPHINVKWQGLQRRIHIIKSLNFECRIFVRLQYRI